MKNNKKLFFLIIIFIFIVSCGVKNNIERQSRQEVHDNEIGTFQIQKDWIKKQLDDDKECYLSPDNQKSICYTTFELDTENTYNPEKTKSNLKNILNKRKKIRKKDFKIVDSEEKTNKGYSYYVMKYTENKKNKNLYGFEKIFEISNNKFGIIIIYGNFSSENEFNNYIETLENTHKLPNE